MSLRVDTVSLIPGMLVCGNRGLGVRGSQVPASGDAGAGFLYNDLSLPADADKEVRGLIVTPPAAGTLVVNEDSSFTFTAPDGAYSFVYRLFVDGADLGTATVTLAVGVTAQFLRPISDISNSGWTPSTGASLATCIGEAVRDDATYISATAPGAICEVLLGTSSGDPLSSINHLPRIVMSAGSGGIILRLKQGATVIKAWTYASLPLTDTLHEPTLTSGEIDAISDYTDLRLEMETTS